MTRSCCHMLASVALASVCSSLVGCARPDGSSSPADRERGVVSTPLAIGVGDPIVGRTSLADRVLLLTQSRQLVELWPASGTVVRRAVLGLEPLERIRGLARLDNGTIWTLVGRDELVEISEGRAGRRLALPAPAVALYGAGARLVYQVVDFDPPAPALLATEPGGADRQVWGPLRTRMFGLSRAENMVLNLVVCGFGSRGLVPCWFAVGDEVAVVDVAGGGRIVRLEGVRTIAADDVLTGDVSARPLRDVFARAADDVWVLGVDVVAASDETSARQWQIVQFDGLGRARQVRRLEKACRVFLAMTTASAWLLANDGSIVRVDL